MIDASNIHDVRRVVSARAMMAGLFALALGSAAVAQEPRSAGVAVTAAPDQAQAAAPRDESALAKWWNGKRATGDWFGARDVLADNGLTLNSTWRGIYFGIVSSENGTGNAFTQELAFGARLDFAKLTRVQAINGLAAFGEVRWREPGGGANPNEIVEASSLFNPSRYAGGVGWRLMNFGLQYTTPELFGVKDFLSVTGGWLQPQKEFVEQPLARLFANNAMASAEGLGGNIPFSSSFSTWGGTLQVKPVEWSYVKGGLFMSFPNPTDSLNNGLMFQGINGENGLFAMGETGITPKIGPSKLPGRYAFGGYYYGEDNEEYGTSKYGFYWQADQMILRESSSAADKLSEQGLRLFSLFVATPAYNNRYPFYFQGGLVYEGLIPSRDNDQLMAGVAYGQYSGDTQPGRTGTTLLEAGYRVKINGWSFVQPFAQYIAQPSGKTSVADAAILGLFMGLDF